jgi:hypothetical protein
LIFENTDRAGSFKSDHLLKLMTALGVMLLFSADRNLLVTHFIWGGRSNIVYMTMLSILIVVFSLLLLLASNHFQLKIQSRYKQLLIGSSILALYFLAHEFVFGDGLVSAKYTVFLMIISVSLMVRYNFFFVFKVLGYLGGILCIFIIMQQILVLGLTGGDLSQFEVFIRGESWGRWASCDYVITYGLGMFERCAAQPDTIVFGLKLNRSLFFSTEPKYLSSILLVTLSAILISRSRSSVRLWFVVLHFLTLGFVGSVSAFLILIISGLMITMMYIGARGYILLVFLLPIFVFPILIKFTLQLAGVDGFVLNRLMSASGSIGSDGLQAISILGESFGACADKMCRDSQGLLGSLLGIYGLVGLGLFGGFLYLAIIPMFRLLKHKKADLSLRFGLMVLLNTYVIFNIYFFGDLFNMYGLLIVLTLILLPGYLTDKWNLVS